MARRSAGRHAVAMLARSVAGVISAICFTALCIGCGPTGSDNTIERWLGPHLHFEMRGTLDGHDLTFSLDEEQVLSRPSGIYGKRTWAVPDTTDLSTYSRGIFVEAEIRVNHPVVYALVENLARIEIEIRGEKDLITTPPGTELTIVPRDDTKTYEVFTTPKMIFLEVEFQNKVGLKYYQEAAQEGSFTQYENSGTLAADGLTFEEDSGKVGGYFRARWSTAEELTGSFTVPGGQVDIESWGDRL